MKIDKNHPRAKSLIVREKLVKGVEMGITSLAGLIAHGRGEAFDYLLSEKTNDFARSSIKAAAALLLLSKNPILSVNGNTAILSRNEFIKTAKLLKCKIEVNLFHYTKRRVELIEKYFQKIDPEVVLSSRGRKITVPQIASRRKIMLREGIGKADTVLVPLEDGDRCGALIKTGKKVVAIDLNPLSRTANTASITIVDNIHRAMPSLIAQIIILKRKKKNELIRIIKNYDNKNALNKALSLISERVKYLSNL